MKEAGRRQLFTGLITVTAVGVDRAKCLIGFIVVPVSSSYAEQALLPKQSVSESQQAGIRVHLTSKAQQRFLSLSGNNECSVGTAVIQRWENCRSRQPAY